MSTSLKLTKDPIWYLLKKVMEDPANYEILDLEEAQSEAEVFQVAYANA